jgi:hypothetical protein
MPPGLDAEHVVLSPTRFFSMNLVGTGSNSIVPGTYFQNIAKPSVLVDTKYLKFNLEDDIN